MEDKNIVLKSADLVGCHRNTHICVDVKTFLRNERIAKLNKQYTGVLMRDGAEHFSFTEILPVTPGKRNPRVFEGEYVTLTLLADGSFRPNFKQMKLGKGVNVDGYAIGVCNELRRALAGLVEE